MHQTISASVSEIEQSKHKKEKNINEFRMDCHIIIVLPDTQRKIHCARAQ